jgi:hypothetical protein
MEGPLGGAGCRSDSVVTTEVGDVDGGPLGVLTTGPAAATTEVEDVDGGPLEGAGDMSGSSHHLSWRRR